MYLLFIFEPQYARILVNGHIYVATLTPEAIPYWHIGDTGPRSRGNSKEEPRNGRNGVQHASILEFSAEFAVPTVWKPDVSTNKHDESLAWHCGGRSVSEEPTHPLR